MKGEKQARMITALATDQRGASALLMVFVVLVLSGIGYTLADLTAAKLNSVPATLNGAKAFYLAEAGTQYAAKYLNELADWSSVEEQTRNLEGGSFIVTFSDYSSGNPESITVTCTGTSGTGTRVVKTTFER